MGNQLLKGYTLQGQPISNIGCERMWRIYQGHKQNTNTAATIFALEKKSLPKGQREELILFAKRQAMSLARIRHPGVLAISEALIEDEQVLAFSTQQVQGNLSMLARDNKLKQIISNEIQLRLNLFPVLDTVQFLHDNVKTVHLGLNFDNIYITKQGKWKISGFSNSHVHGGEGLQDLKNYRCSNYCYSPPEIVNQKKFQKKSDIYSFGILIIDLLLVLVGRYEPKTYKSEAQYAQNFESDLLKKLNCDQLQKLQTYRELKTLMKNVLARDPSKRATLQQLSSSKWLNDKLVLTVRYLQNITNYDNKQQIQFLKGLLGILSHFESKILLRKVVPLLLDLLKFKHLIPSVVYICLQTMKNGKIISETDFKEKIWPAFRKVVQGKQMTAHSLYLFVDNMEKIQKIVGMQQLVQCVIPLYVKCFDCPPKLKQLALVKTDYILNKMDYQFVKTKMIPKVMNCIKDQNSDIHKKGLIALRKSIKILDTQTITSTVLPGLQACKKSGSDPFINAITVSIYTMLGKTLPSDTLCSKLIPTILPFLSDPNVGPQDFYNYKNALLTMIQKIEGERKKFWDESQISQGAGFSQKDFEFEDQSKRNQAPQSNIGKGDYNFLSNYNKNPQGEQKNENPQHQQRQQSHTNQSQSRKQIDFNFSSPWNFDNLPKAQPPQQQPGPVLNKQSSNNMNNIGMNYSSGFQMNSNAIKTQQAANHKSQQFGFGGLGGFSGVGSSFNTGNSSFNNMGTSGYQSNPWSNITKSEPINQPISPQSRTMPKLKGPDANKQRQQQPPVQSYSHQLDPWASIDLGESSTPENSSWNYQTSTYTNPIQNNNMQNLSYNNPISVANSQKQEKLKNQYGNALGNSGGAYFGNSGDDPFAQLDKVNSDLGFGMGKSSYGMSNLPGSGGNLGLNVGYEGFGQTSTSNQYSLGQNINTGYQNMNMNTNMNTNMNKGMNTGLGMGGFGELGLPQQKKNTGDNFDLL